MLDIKEVLLEENVCLNLKASTKDEAIEEMCDMLSQNGCISDKGAFMKEIYNREAEGLTGIGDGIAIPHGRNQCVQRTVIAFGRTKADIDWGSYDEQPVHCIIMFAVRDVDMSQHIILLSHVAQLLLDKDVIEMLETASNAEEVVNILRKEGCE